MDYERKYKQLHKFISDLYPFMSEYCKEKVEGFLPEFKESEDERIRKFLIKWIQDNYYHGTTEIPTKTLIGWLEKQGSEPNWCHHKVDLSNCSEEYRKAYYDGWNNCNQQHSQCKSDGNDVVKCLINGMKFYYEDNEEATWGTEKFSMKVKDILSWLEKQCGEKPADKVELKFKVGDWVVCGKLVTQITSIEDDGYTNSGQGFISFETAKKFHLWTIQDAKDGDVLVTTFDEDNMIVMYHSMCTIDTINVHCCLDNKFVCWNLGTFDAEYVKPATKEQRDLLFQKMKEAGYEWDAEKKELRKIEQKSWSKEDSMMIEETLYFLKEYQQSNRCKDESGMQNSVSCEKWLKSLKQRCT